MTCPRHKTPSRLFRALVRESAATNSFSDIELANYYGTSPATIFKIKKNGWNDNLDEDKTYASATSIAESYITLDGDDNDNDEGCPVDHTAAQSAIKSEVDEAIAVDALWSSSSSTVSESEDEDYVPSGHDTDGPSDGGSVKERHSERLKGMVAPFVRTSESQTPMNDLRSYQMKQRAQDIYKRREAGLQERKKNKRIFLSVLRESEAKQAPADRQVSRRGQLKSQGPRMSLVNDSSKASASPAHFGGDFVPVELPQKQEHSISPPRPSTLLQQKAANYFSEISKQNSIAPLIPLKRERSESLEDLTCRRTTQKIAPSGEVEPGPVLAALSPPVPTREHAKDVLDFVYRIGLDDHHVEILSKHGLCGKKDFEFARFESREMQDNLQSKLLADGFTTIDYMRLHDGLRRAFKE